jgi:hypothetical protein
MDYRRAFVAGTALVLAGCTAAAVVSDGQLAINDTEAVVNALEATHTLPASVGTIASLVIVGLQGLLNAYKSSVATGASTESTAIAALTSAVTSLRAAAPNAQIQAEATQALDALATLNADSSETIQNQVLALSATVLVDYLKTQVPVGAVYGAGNASHVSTLLTDAEAHIAAMQAAP